MGTPEGYYKNFPRATLGKPREGWLCPKCGGGVAPDVLRCPCIPVVQFAPADHPSDREA